MHMNLVFKTLKCVLNQTKAKNGKNVANECEQLTKWKQTKNKNSIYIYMKNTKEKL